VAWMQTWAMTHFAPAGQPPPRMESLSVPQKAWLVLTGVQVARPHNDHTPRDVGLAYEVRRIPVGTGESLEAWWMPQTQPRGLVLLFPGYASPKESLISPDGGNTPQTLVNRTALAIEAGELDVAVLVGAEGIYSRRRARRGNGRIPYTSDESAEASV